MSTGTAAAPRPLHAWFMDWLDATPDSLYFKKAAEGQIMFIRDTLGRAMVGARKEWEAAVSVIGEHHSKSVRLPVYKVTLPGLDLVLRNNFYDWKVSVVSEDLIHNVEGWGLFDETQAISACYCEGFPREWVFGPYAESKRRFTVEILTQYDLYAFCLLLRGKR